MAALTVRRRLDERRVGAAGVAARRLRRRLGHPRLRGHRARRAGPHRGCQALPGRRQTGPAALYVGLTRGREVNVAYYCITAETEATALDAPADGALVDRAEAAQLGSGCSSASSSTPTRNARPPRCCAPNSSASTPSTASTRSGPTSPAPTRPRSTLRPCAGRWPPCSAVTWMASGRPRPCSPTRRRHPDPVARRHPDPVARRRRRGRARPTRCSPGPCPRRRGSATTAPPGRRRSAGSAHLGRACADSGPSSLAAFGSGRKPGPT
jgi:hypothetical protein